MDTTFMNSENSKGSESYKLLLNLTDKINLKRSGQFVALSWKTLSKMRKIQKIKKNHEK